jgi:DNA-binding CsgD family transcriptional regulator
MGNKLTERELQVLEGMAGGSSNAEIARALFVTEETAKTHARSLYRKLGARDRAHAVAIGFRQSLLVADRSDETARLVAARAWLTEWKPIRTFAPDDSRFARLYDGFADRLGVEPPT